MILKNHNYSFIAEQNTKLEDLHIPVIENKAFKSIKTSCGCTQVKTTPTEYIISFDTLSLVKWMVTDPETQHYFIKSVNFTIIHEDDTKEKVNIDIAVYDSI
jgi:hypothetical protein